MKRISSRQNPLVRRIREAIREHADEIVLEGPKQIRDALSAGWTPTLLAATEEEGAFSGAHAPESVIFTEEVFRSIAGTRATQGAIGLFARPEQSAASILGNRSTVSVALDGVQDPGNVGTIVRLAAAFDAAGVLLLPGCADPFGPKAIRSSAGAILHVPVAEITRAELLAAEIPLYAAAMDGRQTDPPARDALLIFGNEGTGVSPELLDRASTISVPMSSRVESLNVAASAAILLSRSYQLR